MSRCKLRAKTQKPKQYRTATMTGLQFSKNYTIFGRQKNMCRDHDARRTAQFQLTQCNDLPMKVSPHCARRWWRLSSRPCALPDEAILRPCHQKHDNILFSIERDSRVSTYRVCLGNALGLFLSAIQTLIRSADIDSR